MPSQKGSSKGPKKDPVAKVEEKPSSSTPRKSGNEIDDIFASKKRKKPQQEKVDKQAKDEAGKQDKMNKRKRMKKREEGPKERGFAEPPPQPRKRMNGFAVYTEEELGIGKEDAGGTPLCPFDCSCCF